MITVPADTPLTERALLVHAVEHLEDLHDKISVIYDTLMLFRPLLEKLAPGGGADYLTITQTVRELKKNGRRRP